MQAIVDFLNLPVSMSSGEYPLFTSQDAVLTKYTFQSLTLNVRKDMQQVIKVADFQYSDKVNVVRIRGVGFFWVIAYDTKTDVQGSVTFTLSACAPSSKFILGQTMIGEFSRTATNRCPWLKRQAVSGDILPTRAVNLPMMGVNDRGNLKVWIQVTSTTYITSTGSATENRYATYGFFATVNDRGGWGDYVAADGEGENRKYYPNIQDVISNPEYMGLQASTIQDISISVRCPFKYSENGLYMNLIESDGTVIPTNAVGPNDPNITGGAFAFYNLSDPAFIYAVPLIETVTVSLSALERASGTIMLKDHTGAAIATVPTSWGSSFEISTQCIGDHGKLLTLVTIEGVEFTIQEGHLPYVGSAWAEYVAYSLSYDRQAMENSIYYANQRMTADLLTGAAGAIQGAGVAMIGGSGPLAAITGIANFGLSAAGTMIERSISERQARDEQALAERRVQGQAGTAYSAAYGVIYCLMNLRHPALIEVDMPSNLTQALDEAYCDLHGYPAEGRQVVSAVAGYWKGRILTETNIDKGPWFDELNRCFSNGIKFKTIS